MLQEIATMLSALDEGRLGLLPAEVRFLLLVIQCNAHRIVDEQSGEVVFY